MYTRLHEYIAGQRIDERVGRGVSGGFDGIVASISFLGRGCVRGGGGGSGLKGLRRLSQRAL